MNETWIKQVIVIIQIKLSESEVPKNKTQVVKIYSTTQNSQNQVKMKAIWRNISKQNKSMFKWKIRQEGKWY